MTNPKRDTLADLIRKYGMEQSRWKQKLHIKDNNVVKVYDKVIDDLTKLQAEQQQQIDELKKNILQKIREYRPYMNTAEAIDSTRVLRWVLKQLPKAEQPKQEDLDPLTGDEKRAIHNSFIEDKTSTSGFTSNLTQKTTVPKDGEVVEIKKYISGPASFGTCPKCACSNGGLVTECFHCGIKFKRID